MGTLRYYNTIRNFNNILALSNQNVGLVMTGAGHHRNYSKNKDTCCKDISQTEGRTVENWPKGDSAMQIWRCDGSQEPQPTNYDPYKIRSPEVVVPPLPPSNAKEVPNEDMQESEVFKTENNLGFNMPSSTIQNLFHNSHIVHPDNWKQKSLDKTQRLNMGVGQEILPRLGYHGKNKYKYAFHEPWNPLDRLTLLEQAEKDESQHSDEVVATDKNDNEMA